ncbi:Hypothetical protein DEACI_2633 [Acididesulfobacillus acetoxydans]|uniref:Uncharacterized protein n=1 Tax=Acididesulfobacillus acetoxydans TaxID=1561005 RepID=A0A8S0WGK4_9FIRM|nr:Hypothetical protein DEACI_2633 [Acididesulfobacillus acetoxydans]CEJ08194.1 Hypothetical protein DEACI_2669 [Acididesulfobacillus acetoxydans]
MICGPWRLTSSPVETRGFLSLPKDLRWPYKWPLYCHRQAAALLLIALTQEFDPVFGPEIALINEELPSRAPS